MIDGAPTTTATTRAAAATIATPVWREKREDEAGRRMGRRPGAGTRGASYGTSWCAGVAAAGCGGSGSFFSAALAAALGLSFLSAFLAGTAAAVVVQVRRFADAPLSGTLMRTRPGRGSVPMIPSRRRHLSTTPPARPSSHRVRNAPVEPCHHHTAAIGLGHASAAEDVHLDAVGRHHGPPMGEPALEDDGLAPS